MNTLRDQVKDHLRKHPKQSDKGGKKNFLAINRVRLAVLEDGRKEKQRIIIEEESRKKIQKELFDKRRKVREDHVDK
jgi:preprotein translocase subunit Sec63